MPNPYHDPRNGQFTNAPGGDSYDVTAWRKAGTPQWKAEQKRHSDRAKHLRSAREKAAAADNTPGTGRHAKRPGADTGANDKYIPSADDLEKLRRIANGGDMGTDRPPRPSRNHVWSTQLRAWVDLFPKDFIRRDKSN